MKMKTKGKRVMMPELQLRYPRKHQSTMPETTWYTETAQEDYIAQVEEQNPENFTVPTAMDYHQNDNGSILDIEDPTSYIVYDNTTVDDDINATNDENSEAEADNITAKYNFEDRYGIRTSHYNLRPRKKELLSPPYHVRGY